MQLKERLLTGHGKVGVIGLGYIGLSTAMAYAREGVRVIGYDLSMSKVQAIHRCHLATIMPELEKWVGYRLEDLDKTMLEVTTDWESFIKAEPDIVFIAVNTERDGAPWLEPLESVLNGVLPSLPQAIVVVESTVIPGTLAKVSGLRPEYLLRVIHSPRRDWFVSPERNLRALPRLVGGQEVWGAQLADAMSALSIVCDHLITCTLEEAELAKSTENAVQHLLMTVASELALAYPAINVRKVMELAGTHWRIERTWRPGFGTGGYCIPIAGKYLLDGTEAPGHLRTLSAAQESEKANLLTMIDRMKVELSRPIAVLGVTYRENLSVYTHSVGIRMLETNKEGDGKMYWHDVMPVTPVIDATNIERLSSLEEVLTMAGTIILCAPHAEYRMLPRLAAKIRQEGRLRTIYLIDESGFLKGDSSVLNGLYLFYYAAGEPMPWLLRNE